MKIMCELKKLIKSKKIKNKLFNSEKQNKDCLKILLVSTANSRNFFRSQGKPEKSLKKNWVYHIPISYRYVGYLHIIWRINI